MEKNNLDNSSNVLTLLNKITKGDLFNYNDVIKNIDSISEGTLEVLKVIESKGYSIQDGLHYCDWTNDYENLCNFLEKYKDDLPRICWELRKLGVCYITPGRIGTLSSSPSLYLTKYAIFNIKLVSVIKFYKDYKKDEEIVNDIIKYSSAKYHLKKFLPVSNNGTIIGYLAYWLAECNEITKTPIELENK